MKRLQHGNVVCFRDVLDTAQHIHFVLEYMDEGSLASLLSKYGPLSPRLTAVYVRQVLEALAFLHQHGVVHRDVKPNNLLLNTAGVVKIADFGIAHLVETQSNALRTLRVNARAAEGDAPEADIGSPYWIAPEIVEMKEATPKARRSL